MNTRKQLGALFRRAGFVEQAFAHLEDLSTSCAFSWMNRVDLQLWRVLRRFGLGYPETCLLAVYARQRDEGSVRAA
jgi:hypothetical protein